MAYLAIDFFIFSTMKFYILKKFDFFPHMVDNIVKSGDIMFTRIGIDVINSLTISELDILRYIDNNKKEILDMSIQDLSKSVFFSTTSIIRLCKKNWV